MSQSLLGDIRFVMESGSDSRHVFYCLFLFGRSSKSLLELQPFSMCFLFFLTFIMFLSLSLPSVPFLTLSPYFSSAVLYCPWPQLSLTPSLSSYPVVKESHTVKTNKYSCHQQKGKRKVQGVLEASNCCPPPIKNQHRQRNCQGSNDIRYHFTTGVQTVFWLISQHFVLVFFVFLHQTMIICLFR